MRYLYPSKPILITKNQLKSLPLRKRRAELKYNGDRCELIRTNGVWELWTRHGHKFRHYTPHPDLLKEIEGLRVEGDVQLDGELMHFKIPYIKHTLILYDVYIWDGKPLMETPFRKRRELLESAFPHNPYLLDKILTSKWGVIRHLFLSPQLEGDDFTSLFDKVTQYEHIEGLVIKNPEAKLVFGLKNCPEDIWQYKVRKPCGKYSH